jgi:hypothetical protein
LVGYLKKNITEKKKDLVDKYLGIYLKSLNE